MHNSCKREMEIEVVSETEKEMGAERGMEVQITEEQYALELPFY